MVITCWEAFSYCVSLRRESRTPQHCGSALPARLLTDLLSVYCLGPRILRALVSNDRLCTNAANCSDFSISIVCFARGGVKYACLSGLKPWEKQLAVDPGKLVLITLWSAFVCGASKHQGVSELGLGRKQFCFVQNVKASNCVFIPMWNVNETCWNFFWGNKSEQPTRD